MVPWPAFSRIAQLGRCGRYRNLGVGLALVALTLIAQSELLRGETIVGLDSATQFYPWYGFLGERLRAGHLPGWNPHQFSGAPFAADPLSGWTYLPAMLLFTALPLPTAAAAYGLLHPLLAGLFTNAFARTLGMPPAGALLAAVAYSQSGFLAAHNTCCFAFASVAAWLPLALLGAELALKSDRWPARGWWCGVSGLALSQILAAWLGQGSYYALLVVGGYVAYRTLLDPPDGAHGPAGRLAMLGLHGGGILLFGFGLAAAGLLPRLEYNALSNLAGGYPDGDVNVGGWSVQDWRQLVDPGYWHAGAVTVLLAIGAPLVARKRFATPYFAVLTLGALLLTGHGPTPLHGLLSLLPRFAQLHGHVPERIMTVAYLGIALLAGATLSRVARGRVLSPLVLAVVCAELLWANGVYTAEHLALPDGRVDKLQRVDLAAYYEPTEAGRFLKSGPPERSRYFGYAPEVGGRAYTERFTDPRTTALQVNNRAISLGLHDVQGYSAVHLARYDEYLVAMNGRVQNYHNADVFGPALDSPLLDLLNARYIVVPVLTPANGAELRHLDLPELGRAYPTVYEDAEVKVLENPRVMPRAWIVHAARQVEPGQALELLSSGTVDPRQTVLLEQDAAALGRPGDPSADQASILAYDPDRIRLTTATDSDGLLVLGEVYYPAWKAYVDDRPVPLYQANHALRAIPVPAGEHAVELRYESSALRAGLAISSAMCLALATLGIATGRRWRHCAGERGPR